MRTAPDDDEVSRVPRPARARAGLVVLAALADAACVLGLASVAVAAHANGDGTVRLLSVTWPFALAAIVGWFAARAWRRPWRLWPTGVVVWGCTWALGVVLRVLTDEGAFPTFHIVSFGFLAATMLGWRSVVVLARVLRPTPPRVTVQMDDDGGPRK